jgi:hypothetical protein
VLVPKRKDSCAERVTAVMKASKVNSFLFVIAISGEYIFINNS